MGARDSNSFLVDGGDRQERSDIDHSDDKERMPLATLERLLEDIRNEPRWRIEADKCCDYYDNHQLDRETLDALQARGLGAIIRNIIWPTINTILGLEERTKTDWQVGTDYEDQQDVASVMNVKLAEAEKAAFADRAISEAYAGMVKAGFQAVEVSRASNPFDYPYRVCAVHRRELRWDWRSRKNDWKDARWLTRARWYDKDVACAHFPRHAQVIEQAVNKWEGWEGQLSMMAPEGGHELNQALDLERATKIDEQGWRDTERGQVCIFEVSYRKWYRGLVLKLPRGRVVEFNPRNQQQLAIVQAGVAQPEEHVYDKIRKAFFCGPHRLADFPTGRRRFEYVPFWAYREDTTGVPYGQIRSMMSAQDEINARAANMYWLLKARRMLIDSDALDLSENSLSDAEYQFGRADGVIVLNPRRQRENAVQIMENLQLAESHRVAMQEAIQAISQVSGIYQSMMGQNTSTTAARAINALLDAGTTGLAEMNGNYGWARREVGDRLLELVREDMTQETAVAVDTGTTKRSIVVNRRIMDPDTGQELVENSVQSAMVRVTLADVPSSPSHRDAQFVQWSEILKSLPPEIQALLAPFVVEGSNLEKRKEAAKIIRDKLGLIDEKSPEGKKAKAEAEAMAQAQAEQLAKQFDAELREVNARSAKLEAEAQKVLAEAGLGDDGKSAEIMKIKAEYEKKIMQLMRDKMLIEVERKLDGAKREIEAETQVAEAREETEREKLRLASQERIAAQDKVADDKLETIKEQMQGLAEEVDERVAEIMDGLKQEREKEKANREVTQAKDDAKRQVEEAKRKVDEVKTKAEIDKKMTAFDAKTKVAAAKAAKRPAAKK
jgi:hypothetical protein